VSKSNKFIFNNYAEYFRLTRPLSIFQRKRLFNDLCPSERDFLENDFDKNGWEQLLIQNEINRRSDSIKKKYNKDLFLIRIKLSNNKKVKIKRSLWNHVVSTFADIPSGYLKPVLGGVVSRVDRDDPSFVILQIDR
jgi:hypothetical protein|tara:strand:+ start:5766 stop:6173 length:408 start_codon:yes stop_codon:yes gene_type:complete